jgi:anti-sigma factor ChrR (cupin superfamily)
MTPFDHSPEHIRDRAALYALQALDREEASAFESHLSDGCALCQSEVDAFAAAAAELAFGAAPQQPRPELRQRLLQSVAGDNPPAMLERDGILFARAAQLPWVDHPRVPGMQVKLLHHDPRSGRRTQLVRLAAGSGYPAHRHADVEEIYLIDGDLTLSGVTMRGGEYCRAAAGSIHDAIRSYTGCLFLATNSEHDEMISD